MKFAKKIQSVKRCRRCLIAFAGAVVLSIVNCFPSAALGEVDLSAHAKFQQDVINRDKNDVLSNFEGSTQERSIIDLRLNAKKRFENFEVQVQGEALGQSGSLLKSENSAASLSPESRLGSGVSLNDETRFLDLGREVHQRNSEQLFLRVDRAFIRYTESNVVASVGRQALSWGNGLTFHVLDRTNPFAPLEIDKDYKTGDDMAYLQYLYADGSDTQFVAVGRRDDERSVQAEESSFVLKHHQLLGDSGIEADLLAGEHYGDAFFGGGLSFEAGGAVFRLDVSLLNTDTDNENISFISNVDRTFFLYGFNVYWFLEYYYNDIGSEGGYSSLSQELAAQLSRGEVFFLGKQYLSTGGRIEVHPLVNIYPLSIFNLHDQSSVHQLRVLFDVMSDLTILIGGAAFVGPQESEFGGFQSQPGVLLESESVFFVRISYYL